MVDVIYRQAGQADIVLLARHHRAMFAEMRGRAGLPLQASCCAPENDERGMDFDRLEKAQKEKLRQQLGNTCMAWLAESGRRVVASGCLSLLCATPVPEDPSCEIGFLHSLYVEKDMRGQGIGGELVDRLLEYGRNLGLHRIQLAASEAGRGLYARKGFVPLEQMIVWL